MRIVKRIAFAVAGAALAVGLVAGGTNMYHHGHHQRPVADGMYHHG